MQVLDRGEKIELLVDKTENLQFQVCVILPTLCLESNLCDCADWHSGKYECAQADSFQRQGRQLRRKMWFQNLQMKLMVGGAILVFIIIVWLFACGGFKC